MKILLRLLPYFIVFFSVSGAGIFSFLLYADIHNRHDVVDGREVAGRVTETQNSVKRKLSDRFIFDSVDIDDHVFWNDTIQTTPGSKVKIDLKDGTKIVLGESALVVLERVSGGLSLKLKSGNIVIEGDSKDKAVKVNGVNVEKDNKSLSLNVDEKSGKITATKTTDDGIAEKVDLEALRKKEEEAKRLEAERAAREAEARRIAEEKEKEEEERNRELLPPELIAPKPNGRVDLSENTTVWVWSPIDGAIEYIFSIRTISKIHPHVVYERTVNTNRARIEEDIDDGVYFWSVVGKDRFGKSSPASIIKIEITHSDSLAAPEIDTTEVQ